MGPDQPIAATIRTSNGGLGFSSAEFQYPREQDVARDLCRQPIPPALWQKPNMDGVMDESYLLFVGRPAPFEAILLWHAPCSCPYSGCKIAGSDLGVWRLLGWRRRPPDNRLAPSTKAVRLIAGRLLQTH